MDELNELSDNTDARRNDLLVQSRFRNLILWDLMAGRTAAEVSRDTGTSQNQFGKLLNLKRSPLNKGKFGRPGDGQYCKSAIAIATHFSMLVEDLFPLSLYSIKLPDIVEREYSSIDVLPMIAAAGYPSLLPGPEEHAISEELKRDLDQCIADSENKKKQGATVLRLRFGLDGGGERTLDEVASELGVSRERARSIEARMLRELRHPSRSKMLRQYVDDLRD